MWRKREQLRIFVLSTYLFKPQLRVYTVSHMFNMHDHEDFPPLAYHGYGLLLGFAMWQLAHAMSQLP